MAKGKLYHILMGIGPFPDGSIVPRGTINQLKKCSPKAIKLLLSAGRIAEVVAPPLKIIPGWEERAEALAGVGIENVAQLVTADLPAVAEELDVPVEGLEKAADTVRKYVGLQSETEEDLDG